MANRPTGATAGVVTAVAMATMLFGLVIGFFVGRTTDPDPTTMVATPLTLPQTSTTRPPGDTVPPRAPAGSATPPSTDLDPETIGTVDDPIPVGQAYVLGLYEIEVLGVDRDAGAALSEFEASNPAAPEGRRHVLVEVAVRSTDDAGLGNPAAIRFFLSDGLARWNDFESQCGLVPEAIVETGLLEKGREAVGKVCFTVPDDVAGDLLFGTEGFNGPLYFSLPE